MAVLHMVNFLTVTTFLILSSLLYGSSTAENASNDKEFNNTSTTEDGNNQTSSLSSPQKNEDDESETVPEPSALLADSSNYRMPGLFGFNGGEPFYLEKDPVTGAVNFSVKSSAAKNDDEEEPPTGPSLKNHKISETENSDDYYYDEEESEDNIDRRDGNIYETDRDRMNNFSPGKAYSANVNGVNTNREHHQKYTSTYSNKFPLISSSYANTKFQGTGGGNKNHRPYVTSSTQSPSYYTIRPQPTFLTNTPFRGTVKFSSTLPTTSKAPKESDHTVTDTTKYKPITEDYDDYDYQKTTSQNNDHQQENSNEIVTNKQPPTKDEGNEEKDNYAEENENNQSESILSQEKKNISVVTPEYSDSLFTKTTHSPVDYEEEINEDYESEESTNFSLAELFGYGKPSSKKEEKRPQTEQKEQEKPIQDQIHHQQNPTQGQIHQQQNPTQGQIHQQQNPTQGQIHQQQNPTQGQIHQQQNPTRDQIQQQHQNQEDEEGYEISLPITVSQTSPTSQSVYVTPATSNLPILTQQDDRYIEQNFISKKNETVSQPQPAVKSTTPAILSTRRPSTTQTPGIIYSEPGTIRPQNYETSLPVNVPVQSNFKPFPTQKPEKYNPPPFSVHTEIHRPNSTETALPDLISNPSQRVNTVYKPNSNPLQGKPPNFSGNFFDITTEKNNPYGSYAEEPFRPIFGPGELDDRPLIHRPQHQPLIAPPNKDKNTNSVPSPGTVNIVSKPPILENVNIPNETPTRWSYPHNDGTSTFFQLPPQDKQKQNVANPSGNAGSGRPRPHPQASPFIEDSDNQNLRINSQQKPVLVSDISIPVRNSIPNHTRIPVNININQNPSATLHFQDDVKPEWTNNNAQRQGDKGHVVFPDSIPQGAKPQVDIVKRPSATLPEREATLNQEDRFHQLSSISRPEHQEQGPNQHRPVPRPENQNTAPSIHEMVKEPAQELRPPAEPVELKKSSTSRPNWESRPPFSHVPASQTAAKPKLDTVPYQYVQNPPNSGSDYHSHPNFSPEGSYQGNRPQQISKYHNKNSNLPNILPHFRPNAKISHVHVDNGGIVQAHTYFGNQRQPLLERPSRRPSSEFMGHLHPPPPPYRRRVNRNDTPGSQDIFPLEKIPPQPPAVIQQRPFVHRRTGPHVTDGSDTQPQVATLQMMQQHQHQGSNSHFLSRPLAARDDFPHSHEELNPPVQLKYPSGSSLDTEASEKHPVFVVYPVNSSPVNIGTGTSDNSGVVVGTRGPQRPVPPSNLDSESDLALSSEDIASLPFPSHKNQKPILQRPSDRLDSVSNNNNNNNIRHPIKTDFPYPLEKPDTFIDSDKNDEKQIGERNQEKTSAFGSDTSVDRYDHEFTIVDDGIEAEVHNSNDEKPGDDTEINIIPYLQDYMPFATKKPVQVTKVSSEKIPTTNPSYLAVVNSVKPEKNRPNPWNSPNSGHHTQEGRIIYTGISVNEVPSSTSSVLESHQSSSPISVVLKTVQPQTNTTHSPVTHSTSLTPFKITDYSKTSPTTSVSAIAQSSHQQGLVGSGGSEFTVSAVMHTHPQALSNHRPPEGASSTTVPPQLNFQAPFLASANIGGTPTNQGWSVVGKGNPNNERMKPGAVEKADVSSEKTDTVSEEGPDSSDFDFENFRPQLFGGFKPIYSFPVENGEEQTKFLQTTERQEKML